MIEIDEIISNKTEDRLSLKRILEEDPSLKQEIGWDDSADDENVEWVRTIKAWTPAKDPEQEPCEDTISRQAVLDAMSDTWKHICSVARRKHPTKGEEAVYNDMRNTVKQISPVKPQAKTGRWIPGEKAPIECDQCGYGVMPWNNTNYCPKCGSYMKGGKE